MTPVMQFETQALLSIPSVIREIEIWGVAVLMINRYADDAEANSFERAVELRLRWGGYLASNYCGD
jgi:hypothetical protein